MEWASLLSLVVNVVIAGALLGGLGLAAVNTVFVTREYERLVVFRLGRSLGSRGPGLVLLIPAIDRGVRVDLREQFLAVPHQTCITKDNAPISIDFLIYWKVVDSAYSVIQVANFAGASQGIATTTLRAVIGDIALDDVLANREQLNHLLRQKLDEVTERWGVKVTSVEIREIMPPREIQEAMSRQMSAERNRRAMVLESDGKREAGILEAEGEKQAAILRAEGSRQSAILQAEGYALALKSVSEVARGLDGQTIGLQYLDALKQVASSPATKIVLPMEVAGLLRPMMEAAQHAARGNGAVGKGA